MIFVSPFSESMQIKPTVNLKNHILLMFKLTILYINILPSQSPMQIKP